MRAFYYSLIRSRLQSILLRTESGYRFFLKRTYGVDNLKGYPEVPWENGVLKTPRQWEDAVEQVRQLGLYPRSDPSKNWDSLAALSTILRRTDNKAYILDAGAELYSTVLPWLFLYGYKNLRGINLVFNSPVKRGAIHYEYGDITHTRFNEGTFDAITCLSVIEHGVDIRAYFKEMSRILKPGGVLITSTDYYETPIDTKGQYAYGVPIHIFSKTEIIAALEVAKEFDLILTGPLDLNCEEKAVRWEPYGLEYTFAIFTLQKKRCGFTKTEKLLSSSAERESEGIG
jgi:SAM-dependent methyltransferase